MPRQPGCCYEIKIHIEKTDHLNELFKAEDFTSLTWDTPDNKTRKDAEVYAEGRKKTLEEIGYKVTKIEIEWVLDEPEPPKKPKQLLLL